MQTDRGSEEENAVSKLTHKENCQTWFYNFSRESGVTTQKSGFRLQLPITQGVGETGPCRGWPSPRTLSLEWPHLGAAGEQVNTEVLSAIDETGAV